ncbi:MAG: tRNA (adenosine(37)-N6)-dimethylallyltransferase MiaA [Nitrospirota bacterium]|nr:tRNA (adenosine(37)-N6)-dimethylallyltransferase MiaA [Nitrospirota bacterium]MDP2382409.1 tRNA (adenosine(37)-N6)-dimethylallyltransferase MiaA [Nitrospirota bacterium]MDP3597860.1 tRNA (adenosine(37)-N6)-dimethylallyltransferase MiaA [Nitrospirota bacterium]
MMATPTRAIHRLSDIQVWCKPVVVILGPTAVGKSRVAVEVAKAFETEVLTADSRQVYRGMDIGTDKPAQEERQEVPHRLIDLVNPDEPFNAGLYRGQAVDEIDRLYRDHRLPLVVGGTGLYVRTLLKGLCDAPPADPMLRAALRQEAKEQGLDRLYARLIGVDPVAAARLHPRDESKVIRALEVYQLSGRRMSEFQQEHAFAERPFCALIIGLNRDRDVLYRRIEERIDWQLAHGLIEETTHLLSLGYQRESSAMKGLGYRQVAEHLAGEYDAAEMVRRFKRDTRHFSKRQMTWFRKEPGVQWLAIENSDSVAHTAELVIGQVERFLLTLEGQA